jgi:hypothetical protein
MAGCLAISVPANAISLGGISTAKPLNATPVIQKAHGCHRVCTIGPTGWRHRHVGPNCRPLACS